MAQYEPEITLSDCPSWCNVVHDTAEYCGCVGKTQMIPDLPRGFDISMAPARDEDGTPLVLLQADMRIGDLFHNWLTIEQSARLRAALKEAERQALAGKS